MSLFNASVHSDWWIHDGKFLIYFILQAGITQTTVLHLAIFSVFPLEIVGILEINKKVFRYVCGSFNCYTCLLE